MLGILLHASHAPHVLFMPRTSASHASPASLARILYTLCECQCAYFPLIKSQFNFLIHESFHDMNLFIFVFYKNGASF